VNTLTRPGDEVLLEAESHIRRYEQGGIAVNSGCMAHPVAGRQGALSPGDVEAAWRDARDEHVARLALLCIENTHNRAGGAVVPLESIEAVAAAARAHDMRVHFDGARLWNASVATGIPVARWAAHADTVMMCFSKALGAPVGSILAGESEVIQRARRTRKRWGGTMRQVGIIAAACLYALDHHVTRLAEDHTRAKRLAAGFAGAPGVTVIPPDTNIVIAELDASGPTPEAVLGALESRGVRMVSFGGRRLRAIVHLDVDEVGIDRAIEGFRAAVAAAPEAPAEARRG
jgi:threonine aldolase